MERKPEGFASRLAPPSPSIPRRPRLPHHSRLPSSLDQTQSPYTSSNNGIAHQHGLVYHVPTAFRLAVAETVRQNTRVHHQALRELRAVRTGASCRISTHPRLPRESLEPDIGSQDASLLMLCPSFNSDGLPPSKVLRRLIQGALAIQCPTGLVVAGYPWTSRRSLFLPSMDSSPRMRPALMPLFASAIVARSRPPLPATASSLITSELQSSCPDALPPLGPQMSQYCLILYQQSGPGVRLQRQG